MRARAFTGAWNNLPLRVRLTLLYLALLLVLLVALGSFLYFDTRNFMIAATASRLEAIANNSITHLVSPGPPPRPLAPSGTQEPPTATGTAETPPFENVARNLAHDLTWQDTTAVVLDRAGARVADTSTSTNPVASPTPDASSLARAFAGESVTYSATVDGQDALAVLIPVHYPHPDSSIAGVIQMTVPLGPVGQVLQRQRLLIVIGIILALIVGTVGGLWLTQTALAPLQLMIGVCRRIADGDLSQRVNLPHRRDETGQLATAFDEMVERLDNAFTTQRQFVADASHELRTPLTALSGSLEVLLLKPEGDPETTRRVLHGMRREVQRLTRLVADLLTLTRLDARRPTNRKSVELTALAGEVVESIRPLAKNRQVVLETDGDVKCTGDPDQLKQVFYNLLGNAIQSTDAENGAIVLHIERVGQSIRVAVSDNGMGIPEPAQPHIFERFYRVDKARSRASIDSRSGGGSGLGLAIVKGIVEGHGGSIEPVESTPGRGTTIRFTLPGPQKDEASFA